MKNTGNYITKKKKIPTFAALKHSVFLQLRQGRKVDSRFNIPNNNQLAKRSNGISTSIHGSCVKELVHFQPFPTKKEKNHFTHILLCIILFN